jgi:carbonic anhydrase/acetyltransferase-like protein (isoleucine patch superfamily)
MRHRSLPQLLTPLRPRSGSTVTKNIPDWCVLPAPRLTAFISSLRPARSIAIGTPAKVVRTLREEERGVAPAEATAA